MKPGFLRCYKSREERLLRIEIPLYKGVVACRQLSFEDGSGMGAGKYNHFITVALVSNEAGKKASLMNLKLGADSDAEAEEWAAAIMAASEDGGSPPPSKAAAPKSAAVADFGIKDAHKTHQMSYLSSENQNKQSYRGFFNMIVVVAVISNLRTIVDSILSHSDVLKGMADFEATLNPEDLTVLTATASLPVFVITAWAIEKLATTSLSILSTNLVCNLLHTINCTATLGIPWYLCSLTQASPLVCMPMILLATVLFLKVVSYAHANADLRARWIKGEKGGE